MPQDLSFKLAVYLSFYNCTFVLEAFLLFIKIEVVLVISLYLNEAGISDWLLSMASFELWEGRQRLDNKLEDSWSRAGVVLSGAVPTAHSTHLRWLWLPSWSFLVTLMIDIY